MASLFVDVNSDSRVWPVEQSSRLCVPVLLSLMPFDHHLGETLYIFFTWYLFLAFYFQHTFAKAFTHFTILPAKMLSELPGRYKLLSTDGGNHRILGRGAQDSLEPRLSFLFCAFVCGASS